MLGSHLRIACYSLHFAKTDDIELKSSIGGKEGISFSTEERVEKRVVDYESLI
jgi:hypothetical protein